MHRTFLPLIDLLLCSSNLYDGLGGGCEVLETWVNCQRHAWHLRGGVWALRLQELSEVGCGLLVSYGFVKG
jgi:hypothetical protein